MQFSFWQIYIFNIKKKRQNDKNIILSYFFVKILLIV